LVKHRSSAYLLALCVVSSLVSAANSWPQAGSDLTPDPGVRFGELANGMRYAIMKNTTPAGQVSLRLRMDTGALEETDAQQGLAHFLEHMAFRGSAKVADGDVKIRLERLGLKFGPDTNAFTGQSQTVYMFDLPRNDAESLDTGLMLLREVGDALKLDAKLFDTERGVVLSELRLADTPAFHMTLSQQQFLLPGQLVSQRMPIGKSEVLQNAPVSQLIDYYRAYYRPERATLIVVGDIDADAIEARIKAQFGNWTNVARAGADPVYGAPAARGAAARTYVEAGAPSVSTLTWVAPFDPTPDSVAREKRDLIEIIGLAVINRRMQVAAAAADRKFTGAGVFRQNYAHSARLVSLQVRHEAGAWRDALTAADQLRRQAVEQGVQQSEVDREVAELRTSMQSAAAGAATRRTPQLASQLASSVDRQDVFTDPAQELTIGESVFKDLAAATVNATLRSTFQGSGPLAFVASPLAIDGGDGAVLVALHAAEAGDVGAAMVAAKADWPYTDFGAVGRVASRQRIDDFDATLVRFANGVRLNIKSTRFAADRVAVSVRVGGGRLGMPKDKLSVLWAANLGAVVLSGLGKMDYQTQQRVLAGKSVRTALQVGDDAIVLSGQTRPVDLNTQLQLMAAYVTDTGWRPEAFEQLRGTLLPQLAQINSTPLTLFQVNLARLIHNGDPRWAFPTLPYVQAARSEDLKTLIAPSLATGAIEISVVGDVAVDQAVAAVASTFGALPARKTSVVKAKPHEVSFPAGVITPVVLLHQGGADQGIAASGWPTTDVFTNTTRNAARTLLADLMQQRLFEELRQRDGTSYTPQLQSQSSAVFPGYGSLLGFADIPPAKADLFFESLAKIAASLRSTPVTADELDRVRNPEIAKLTQAKQTNEYWLGVLGAVQSEPRFADLARRSLANLQAVTAADIQAEANTWLIDGKQWKLIVQKGNAK
jgi:zinc protease